MSDPTRLADIIHDAMPDEHDWQLYFRRIDDPDGWSLEIRRTLSERIATAVLAALSTTPAPSDWDDGYDAGVLQGLSISGIPEADIDRLWDEHRQKVSAALEGAPDPTRAAIRRGLDEAGYSDPNIVEPIIHAIAAALSTTPAPLDPECDCEPRHVWPCATIGRCDEPGCEAEATCGWPTRPGGTGPNGGYRRTCGPHMREYAKP